MSSQPTETAEPPNEQDPRIQPKINLYAAVYNSPDGVYNSLDGDDFQWAFVCHEPESEQWRVYELVEDADGYKRTEQHATNLNRSDRCRSLIPLGIVKTDRDTLSKTILGVDVASRVSSFTSRFYISETWDSLYKERLVTKIEYRTGAYHLMDYLEKYGGEEGGRKLQGRSTKVVYRDEEDMEEGIEEYMDWWIEGNMYVEEEDTNRQRGA